MQRFLAKLITAGCKDCHHLEAHWEGPNAQAVAVQHARKYNHETWVSIVLDWTYKPD